MTKKTLSVTALFQAYPGKEEELKNALLSLVAPTLKEKGCLNYDLHQSPEDPTKFLFYENWTSREELDAHLQSDHVKAALQHVKELSAKPLEIGFWEKI